MTQITVEVEEVSGRLFLKRFIGDGHYDDYDFDLSVTIPAGSPFIVVNGKSYVVSMESIVQAVLEAVTDPPAPSEV